MVLCAFIQMAGIVRSVGGACINNFTFIFYFPINLVTMLRVFFLPFTYLSELLCIGHSVVPVPLGGRPVFVFVEGFALCNGFV